MTQPVPPHDRWDSGATYEAYVGRWSRLVAREFLRWLSIPAGAAWLDVGCGTGAISQTILLEAAPSHVKGIDRSADFVAYAREHIHDSRAEFAVGDAQALPVGDAAYDAVISALALNFIPDHRKAATEMVRAVKTGGTVAVYVWDYAERMEMMRTFWDAAVALRPSTLDLDESRRFPICKPEALADLFEAVGLRHVETRAIDIPTHFRDLDDYWTPFLHKQGPAPSYLASLAEPDQAALREAIRARLPINADGSIDLVARAWAARGRRA